MRPNRKLPLLFTLLLGCSLFGLSSCAQQAFYYPDHADYGTPAQAGLQHEDIFFQSEDGTRLHGWFIPAQNAGGLIPARATIIHFHGNAQNLSAHKEAVQWLPAHGYNVFLFDYRGYGLSEGRPNQAGLFADSNAALNYVRNRPDVNKNRLLIFGQSLGGTNAIAAVGAGNQAGIRAGSGLLVRNTYSSRRFIGRISPIPLLLIHGTADQVIPDKHSQTLFDLAGEPKQLVLIPNGTHLGLQGKSGYEQLLLNFFNRHSE